MTAETHRALATVFIGKLTELAEPHLGTPVASNGDDDDWNWIGPAMVARIIECAHALQSPIMWGLELDAGTLTRALFDHTVTFAYVGEAPLARLPSFLKSDYQAQLTAHREFLELGLGDWIDPRDEARMRALVADSSVVKLLDVRSMCVHLDKSLGRKGEWSFVALYTTVFRQFSTVVHPTLRCLHQHAYPVPQGRLIGPSNVDDELISVTIQVPALLALALEARAYIELARSSRGCPSAGQTSESA